MFIVSFLGVQKQLSFFANNDSPEQRATHRNMISAFIVDTK